MAKFDSSRRAVLGVLGAAAFASAIAAPAFADDAADVAAAVEKLRKAMFEGDGKTLEALTMPELTYGHSNGRVETQAQYIASLNGKKAFVALEWYDQKVVALGDNAVVRHTFDAINALGEGKVNLAHIHVLQVWKKVGGAWKLMARQSGPLPM